MKYWLYLNGEVPGSYEPEDLAVIPGFGPTALVCPASDDVSERRWERAGAFPEIVTALQASAKPPAPPPEAPPVRLPDAPRATTPEDVLNDSSQKIFRHVNELMAELENRREERALTQSLQRRVAELGVEVASLRERTSYLQGRADLIGGFQDREKELTEALTRARADLHETRGGAERLDADLSKSLSELATLRRALDQAKTQAAEGEKQLLELTRRLTEKEAMLAKAFGIIRRLEETLGDLLPGATAGISKEVPAYPEPPQPAPPAAPAAEPPPYTLDTSPVRSQTTPLPPEGEITPVPPPWQEKLSTLLSSVKGRLQG
ncbi:MAG: hypothetical protein HYZ75_01585 [Elusimicrobia bacterium]|nr:hypothetical protein [Elusimicrobiota bacterium]